MIPTWNKCTISPALCRILARIKDPATGEVRLMTDRELMDKTGWGKKHLRGVYQAGTWESVTCGDMDRFLWACGIHPAKQRRQVWLLERILRQGGDFRRLRHLRPCKGWRENQIVTLLRMLGRVANAERTAA
jgi:hypothetical protein